MASTSETNPSNQSTDVTDVANILLKMKEQQEYIEKMKVELEQKEQRLNSAVAEKRKEMQAYMEGIKKYIEKLKDNVPETELQQVIKGLERCAETGERNPLFEVMVQASALNNAGAVEQEKLRLENEELKKKMQGGLFANESARVSGNKRDFNEISNSNPTGMGFWDSFEASMKLDNQTAIDNNDTK